MAASIKTTRSTTTTTARRTIRKRGKNGQFVASGKSSGKKA